MRVYVCVSTCSCRRGPNGQHQAQRLMHHCSYQHDQAPLSPSANFAYATWVTPSIALIFSRNFSSGANLLASQSPNAPASRAVTTLKSRQPPHTMRCTLLTPLMALTCANYRDTTPASSGGAERHVHDGMQTSGVSSTPSRAIPGECSRRRAKR